MKPFSKKCPGTPEWMTNHWGAMVASVVFVIAIIVCVLSYKKKSPAAERSPGENLGRWWDGRGFPGMWDPSSVSAQIGGDEKLL